MTERREKSRQSQIGSHLGPRFRKQKKNWRTEGASMHDVRKMLGFFDPLPPCHDFVPFVCFLGIPLPNPLRTSYMEAPLSANPNVVGVHEAFIQVGMIFLGGLKLYFLSWMISPYCCSIKKNGFRNLCQRLAFIIATYASASTSSYLPQSLQKTK